MVAKTSIQDREIQLKEICGKLGLQFEGWVDPTKINKSAKFFVTCKNGHRSEKQIKPFVNKNRPNGCYFCSPIKKNTKEKRVLEIKKLAESIGYTFVDFVGVYKDSHSKVSMICDKGHNWDVSIIAFINQGHRCKGCAVHGFNKEKPAYVYIQSLSGQFLKFGITNREPKKRMSAQSNKSIYSHTLLYQKRFDVGSEAIKIEKAIQESVECGVVSREHMQDGYTETTHTKNYEKIISIIEGI